MTWDDFASYCMEQLTSLSGTSPVSDSLGDPGMNGLAREMNMRNNSMELCVGTVIDVCHRIGVYRVDTPQHGVRLSHPLAFSGGLMAGTSAYTPGDRVLLTCVYGTNTGVILGKIGDASCYKDADLRSFITLSEKNQFGDAFQKALFNQEAEPRLVWWSHGTPLQRQDAGEFFIGSPAGPKLFVDPFMGYLSLNDATGIWTFRDDSLLRVAGLNYQLITSGSYEERFNNNGEFSCYSGCCLNTWEALGYYQRPQAPVMEEVKDWESSSDAVSFIEPVHRDARPFHRIITLDGSLGYGRQTHILAPPEAGEVAEYGKKADEQKALSRITQSADGFIGLESVKGISLVKRSVIPAVQQLEVTGDPVKGDTPDKYDFKHVKIKSYGEPKFSAGKTAQVMQSVMALQDYTAYQFNYKLYLPQLRHKKEWYVPEEAASRKGVPAFDLKTKLRELKSKQLLDLPENYTITLDNTEQKYYPVEAGLHFLPDGGIVLHDGYGSELRMAGGQITLSAPGGIWIRSGKDVQVWSGRDLNLRTHDHADITTTKGSVRIKAEKNLELLGGNEGSRSGVVIESRGRGNMDFTKAGEQIETGGIVLKAEKGTASILANTVYARAGVSGSGGGMMLDAGRNKLYTQSTEKLDFIKTRHALNWGDFEAGRVDAVQESRRNQLSVPGQLLCDGHGIFQGQLSADRGLFSGTHVYTKDAVTNIYVSPLKDKAAASFDTTMRQARTYTEQTSVSEQQGYRSGVVQTGFYDKGRPGYSEVLTFSGFSFRTDDELEIPDTFYVYADRWQTICNSGTETWSEKRVSTPSGKGEYPYPGKKYLKEKDCFVTQDTRLVSNGVSKTRWANEEPVADYAEPRYNEPSLKPLDKYPII